MNLGRALHDGLALFAKEVSAAANPPTKDRHALFKLYELSANDKVLVEVRPLNQSDMLDVLFGAYRETRPRMEDATGERAAETESSLRDRMQTRVTEILRALPKDYDLFVPLASFPVASPVDIGLTSKISIRAVPVSWFEKTGNPLANALRKHQETENQLRERNIAALVVRCTGYMGFDDRSSAVANGLSQVRELVYLSSAFGYIREKQVGLMARAMSFDEPVPTSLRVVESPTASVERSVTTSRTFLDYLSRLQPDPTPAGLLDPTREGDAEGEWRRFATKVQQIKPVLEAIADTGELARLRSAVEWVFAALIADEPSVSLVQSFIALEAILGDEESEEKRAVGRISERLADRYSYLVGTTQADRARHRADFKRLYTIRSEIVHGSRTKSGTEHALTHRFQVLHMAESAIRMEAERYLMSKKGPRAFAI